MASLVLPFPNFLQPSVFRFSPFSCILHPFPRCITSNGSSHRSARGSITAFRGVFFIRATSARSTRTSGAAGGTICCATDPGPRAPWPDASTRTCLRSRCAPFLSARRGSGGARRAATRRRRVTASTCASAPLSPDGSRATWKNIASIRRASPFSASTRAAWKPCKCCARGACSRSLTRSIPPGPRRNSSSRKCNAGPAGRRRRDASRRRTSSACRPSGAEANLIVVNSEWSKRALIAQGVPEAKLLTVPVATRSRKSPRSRSPPNPGSTAR